MQTVISIIIVILAIVVLYMAFKRYKENEAFSTMLIIGIIIAVVGIFFLVRVLTGRSFLPFV